MALVRISRVETFCAAHRLHNPSLTDEENRAIFGKCNWPNGHGHNYRLEVTLRGPVDPRTGMVMNLVDLKAAIQDAVLSKVDHRNLDKDVPFFRGPPRPAPCAHARSRRGRADEHRRE